MKKYYLFLQRPAAAEQMRRRVAGVMILQPWPGVAGLTMLLLLLLQTFGLTVMAQSALTDNPPRVQIANGILEGFTDPNAIHTFEGIPFAQPPVGDLRWQEPQPLQHWDGIRKADHFRSNAMQNGVFSDMIFRADSMSEDCLYLNVWTPALSTQERLPVLVYFYGGGFVGGDGSETRYDGESMARKGIVAVTVNYRLGVFGFLAHPELTQESPHHSSGNYALMDQCAALHWVADNIAAFGGDPSKVTIAGESAGSIAVSAQMASPLSKNLITGAIGESGAMINPTLAPLPLATAEQNGLNFAQLAGAHSLAELRALPATQLLAIAKKPNAFHTAATIDGYFLPKAPVEIFAAGEQAHVPLLAGWNATETPYQALMQADAPTPENYIKKVKQLYGDQAAEVLKLYPGRTNEEMIRSATALASDRFIVYSTWKWTDLQAKTSGQPVYRYVFSKPRPGATGAFHAVEIEYAMGNLAANKVYAWTADDYKVSAVMEQYFANFIKTGNPNGEGLPKWTPNTANGKVWQMNINVESRLEPEKDRARYLFLDKQYAK